MSKKKPPPLDEVDTGAAAQQVKRLVPAAGMPPPITTAAPSVFDIAKGASEPAKPARASSALDPDAIAIMRGVPIPPATRFSENANAALTLLQRMQPGDMVQVNKSHGNTLIAQAAKSKIKIVKRKLGADAVGVWRV